MWVCLNIGVCPRNEIWWDNNDNLHTNPSIFFWFSRCASCNIPKIHPKSSRICGQNTDGWWAVAAKPSWLMVVVGPRCIIRPGKIRIFWPLEGFRWGGVGWGGVLTSWRPRPWYYVDKTCRGNLEDVLDATLMTWGRVGWVGGCINVLTTTSLILRRQDMPKKKLMKDPHTKSLCPFFEHQVYVWAWRKNLGQLSAKIFLRQLTKIWWTAQ